MVQWENLRLNLLSNIPCSSWASYPFPTYSTETSVLGKGMVKRKQPFRWKKSKGLCQLIGRFSHYLPGFYDVFYASRCRISEASMVSVVSKSPFFFILVTLVIHLTLFGLTVDSPRPTTKFSQCSKKTTARSLPTSS